MCVCVYSFVCLCIRFMVFVPQPSPLPWLFIYFFIFSYSFLACHLAHLLHKFTLLSTVKWFRLEQNGNGFHIHRVVRNSIQCCWEIAAAKNLCWNEIKFVYVRKIKVYKVWEICLILLILNCTLTKTADPFGYIFYNDFRVFHANARAHTDTNERKKFRFRSVHFFVLSFYFKLCFRWRILL